MDTHPRPAVAVLIMRDRQLLLGRRAAEPAQGKWDILGGFIEAGESAETAAVREIQEETGLKLSALEYLGSLPDVYGETGGPTLNLCFLAEAEGEPKAASDVQSLSWIALDQPPGEMAFRHQEEMLKWLRKRIEAG